jgi:hypothetical protein
MPEPVFHHCNVITFVEPKKMGFYDLDWPSLERDFRSEENRQNRFIYFKAFSERERDLLKASAYIYIYISYHMLDSHNKCINKFIYYISHI